MKLRNKNTGKIGSFCYGRASELCVSWQKDDGFWDKQEYSSLAELNEEWEDYEEPKGKALYWMILTLENFIENEADDRWVDLEDCKQMLEKLKAWERLKDKGFRFCGLKEDYTRTTGNHFPARNGRRYLQFNKSEEDDWLEENWEDLDLLFGGEE